MEICQANIDRLKKSAKEMDDFRKKLIDGEDTLKYFKEIMHLSGCIGLMESIIETSERK